MGGLDAVNTNRRIGSAACYSQPPGAALDEINMATLGTVEEEKKKEKSSGAQSLSHSNPTRIRGGGGLSKSTVTDSI